MPCFGGEPAPHKRRAPGDHGRSVAPAKKSGFLRRLGRRAGLSPGKWRATKGFLVSLDWRVAVFHDSVPLLYLVK